MSYTDYYKQQLQIGLEYQDFVCEVLLKELGFPIITYASKKYQNTKGENKQGIEIKYQSKMQEYQSLYIETHEKSNENNVDFIPSGIFRDDNTWLFLTGDYTVLYIFGIKFLRRVYEAQLYKPSEPKGIKTSKGFVMPLKDAGEHCIKKVILEASSNGNSPTLGK